MCNIPFIIYIVSIFNSSSKMCEMYFRNDFYTKATNAYFFVNFYPG